MNCTAEEQITKLDARLGVGIGAVKERARLNAKITPAVVEVVEAKVVPARKTRTKKV